MRSCDDILLLVSDYLDKNVEGETSDAVNQHLKQCESCNSIYTDLLSIVGQLHKFEEEELPKDFGRVLHEKLCHEKRLLKGGNTKIRKFNKIPPLFRNKNFRAIATIAAVLIFMFFIKDTVKFQSKELKTSGNPMAQDNGKVYTDSANSNQTKAQYSMDSGETKDLVKASPDVEVKSGASVKTNLMESMGGTQNDLKSQEETQLFNQKVAIINPYLFEKKWENSNYTALNTDVLNNSMNISKIGMTLKTVDGKAELVIIKSIAQKYLGIEVASQVAASEGGVSNILYKFTNKNYTLFIGEFNKIYESRITQVNIVYKSSLQKVIQENNVTIQQFDSPILKDSEIKPKIEIQNTQLKRQTLVQENEMLQKELDYTYVTITY